MLQYSNLARILFAWVKNPSGTRALLAHSKPLL
jgi:hypothetical protein